VDNPNLVPTILLVEDTLTQAIFMQHCLEKKGFQVHLARSGEKAMTMLETLPGEILILTDINMPGMDGYELLEKIRQTDSHRGAKILLLLTPGNFEEAQKIVESTADGIVFKSGSEEKFVAQVELAVNMLSTSPPPARDIRLFNQAYRQIVDLQ